MTIFLRFVRNFYLHTGLIRFVDVAVTVYLFTKIPRKEVTAVFDTVASDEEI